MPRPPSFDPLDEVKFITNYFVQGCKPPYSLIVEFSQRPTKNLALLIFGLDWEDIIKDWLRPRNPRHRPPRRHGRKRPRVNVSMDPNDYFGARIRPKGDIYPGIALPGARALFRLGDALDRLNFTAAVVEGLTDIGFETLWGILSAHPEHCPGYAFVNARQVGAQTIVGSAPFNTPIALDDKQSSQHFQGPDPFVFTTYNGPFTVAATAQFRALSSGSTTGVRLLILDNGGNIRGMSQAANMDEGDTVTLSASAEFPPGEFAHIGRAVIVGSLEVRFATILGFAGTWL